MNPVNKLAVGAHRASGDDGFTLIEMIVSIALLSLMLTLLPPALRLGREAWQIDTQLERSAAVASARKVVIRYLEQAVPLRTRGAANGARLIGFDGRPDSVLFVAMAAEPPTSAGLRTHMLALEPAGGDQRLGSSRLVLRHGPFSADQTLREPELGPAESSSILIENVATLKFRYFGPASNSDSQSVWQVSWTQRNTLPALIEITFEPASRSGRRWSEVLVIKPQLNRPN